MAEELVRYAVERGVATVTLDSPHNRNALSTGLLAGLSSAVAAALADDAVRVLVLSHTGPVFCSGADLRETLAAVGAGSMPVSRLGDVLADLWEAPKPVVARVGGPARAGGLGLLAAADVAVCTRAAAFAFTEVRLGVVPAVISPLVLRRLSPRAAAELYLTGEPFDGVRAEQAGLVTVAVSAEHLDAEVARYTAALVRGAPAALAATKGLLRGAGDIRAGDIRAGDIRAGDIRAELAQLASMSAEFFASADGREGMAAFAEKRDPSWVPL